MRRRIVKPFTRMGKWSQTAYQARNRWQRRGETGVILITVALYDPVRTITISGYGAVTGAHAGPGQMVDGVGSERSGRWNTEVLWRIVTGMR